MKENLKHIGGWVATIILLFTIGGVFYKSAGYEARLWDEPKQKWEHQKHVEFSDSILKRLDKAIEIRAENEQHAIKSRKRRDSLYEEQIRINTLNAIQIEKALDLAEKSTKQNDSILREWKGYNDGKNN